MTQAAHNFKALFTKASHAHHFIRTKLLPQQRSVCAHNQLLASRHHPMSTAAVERGNEQQPCNVDATPRVLSIQSHVVHGYVGNKCAIFPLQRLGFEVDPIMSVQFSNHTGYPVFRGQVFGGEDLRTILQGLEENELISYTHLLTGYIGSKSLLQSVAAVAQRLRQQNPNLVYVCDPVMGDEGKLYVSPELLEAFKAEIVPLVRRNRLYCPRLTATQQCLVNVL